MKLPNIKQKFGINLSFSEFLQDSEGKPIVFEHISFMGTSINEEGIIKSLNRFTRQLRLSIKDFFNDLKKNTD